MEKPVIDGANSRGSPTISQNPGTDGSDDQAWKPYLNRKVTEPYEFITNLKLA